MALVIIAFVCLKSTWSEKIKSALFQLLFIPKWNSISHKPLYSTDSLFSLFSPTSRLCRPSFCPSPLFWCENKTWRLLFRLLIDSALCPCLASDLYASCSSFFFFLCFICMKVTGETREGRRKGKGESGRVEKGNEKWEGRVDRRGEKRWM